VKVSRKLDTIVPTPMLAASASRSAISASDRPGSCWRVSAQNQVAIGPRRPGARAPEGKPERRGQEQGGGDEKRAEEDEAREEALANRPSQRRRRAMRRRGGGGLKAERAFGGARPGAGLGGGEGGQARDLPERAGGGGGGPGERDGERPRPTTGAERQRALHRRAVEAAERGGDVGQEGGRDEVAEAHADQRRDRGEDQELCHQKEDERARGDAERAQGAEDRAALFEGEPMAPWTMKRPTAKLRSPKAVRLRWKLSVRRARSPPDSGGRSTRPGAISSSGGRESGWRGRTISRLIRPSIPRSRWAVPMSVKARPGARPSASTTGGRVLAGEPGGGGGGREEEAGAREEGGRVVERDRGRGGAGRGGQRIEAEETHAAAGREQAALDHRGDEPARAPEGDIRLLRDRAAGGLERRQAAAADGLGRAVVGGAGLGVDRLHAGPERGGQREAEDEGEKLHRAPSPVGEKRGEGGAGHGAGPVARLPGVATAGPAGPCVFGAR
jgi:hypothetical protein